MTDNHMVFFAEIAFIYGGNDSSEKDVFGSERSSETTAISSGTGSGIQPQNSWTIQAAKPSMGTSIHRNQAIFFFSSYIKSQKQACDFCHIELLFR